MLLIACAVYGFSAGNLVTLPSLVIQREFEAEAFGMVVGLAWAITQFTYAFGPGILGALRDLTGGYGAPLAALHRAEDRSRRLQSCCGRGQTAPTDFR